MHKQIEGKQMTTANTTAQIASFLNVAPNAIKSVTELFYVYCVVVKGCRARFVSKKIIKVETMEIKKAQEWEEHAYKAIDGKKTFRVFQSFNGWYVKNATGWQTVDRPDICELAEATYRADVAAEIAKRDAIAKSIKPLVVTAQKLYDKEALDTWFGTDLH